MTSFCTQSVSDLVPLVQDPLWPSDGLVLCSACRWSCSFAAGPLSDHDGAAHYLLFTFIWHLFFRLWVEFSVPFLVHADCMGYLFTASLYVVAYIFQIICWTIPALCSPLACMWLCDIATECHADSVICLVGRCFSWGATRILVDNIIVPFSCREYVISFLSMLISWNDSTSRRTSWAQIQLFHPHSPSIVIPIISSFPFCT